MSELESFKCSLGAWCKDFESAGGFYLLIEILVMGSLTLDMGYIR